MKKMWNHSLSNYHQSLLIRYFFVWRCIIYQKIANQTRIWILISNYATHSMAMFNNMNHVFGWIMNYFVFGTIDNLTIIIINICRHHYYYKFWIYTSWIIQIYFSHIQQHMIVQRILVWNKSDCSSKNISKCLVICICSSFDLYLFSIILFNNLVLIIIDLINIVFIQYFRFILLIIILSLELLLLKDIKFAMVFF